MKFPNMTTMTINVPTRLLEAIDIYAEQHLLNRSACIRLLAQQSLNNATKSPDRPPLAKRYAGIDEPLS